MQIKYCIWLIISWRTPIKNDMNRQIVYYAHRSLIILFQTSLQRVCLLGPSSRHPYLPFIIQSTETMQERISESTRSSALLPQNDHLRKVLRDPQVLQFFLNQLQTLPNEVYEVNVAFDKIYIVIYPNKYRHHLRKQQDREEPSCDIESKYVLRVGRSFPLPYSVHIHMLDGAFQPKVSDCRDFYRAVMGRQYEFSTPFLDILESLVRFDEQLHYKNQFYLQMQRVGEFLLGQTYFYHELVEMFSSLVLLKDHIQKKNNVYVGITETHMLGFIELVDRHTHASLSPLRHHHSLVGKQQKQPEELNEATYYKLRLVYSAELQCIDTISYKQSEKTVKLVLKKYKAIKLYHQSEDIKKQYKFQRPEVFLRGILKYVTKFQPCDINFQPYFPEHKKIRRNITLSIDPSSLTKEEDSLGLLVTAANRLQDELSRENGGKDRDDKINSINKLYQKIIEFYSARANPYYLIFVNKLNNIYHKYYIAAKKNSK